MNRNDFIKWFEEKFGKLDFQSDSFSTYRHESNYEPLMYDLYSINKDTIEYGFDEPGYGYTNFITRIGTFEEFIKAYENDTTKSFGTEANY